jgi:hypothetical protein
MINHIEILNSSVSENVTSVVSEWLQAQEAEEAAAQRGEDSMFDWGRQLLRKAKKALVDLVASVEAFLDTYVMDMTDKESVVELIKALEDHKAAKLNHLELQSSLRNATAQAASTANSVKKAEVARAASKDSANRTAVLVVEANQTLQAALDSLKETRAGLAAVQRSLNHSRDVLAARSAEAEKAVLCSISPSGPPRIAAMTSGSAKTSSR